MDLLIKEIEMPKGRDQLCLYVQSDGTVNVEIDTFEGDIQELPNTKAIELPPHERLIDADVLQAELEKHSYPSVREWYYAEVGQIIDECPTVLEAST